MSFALRSKWTLQPTATLVMPSEFGTPSLLQTTNITLITTRFTGRPPPLGGGVGVGVGPGPGVGVGEGWGFGFGAPVSGAAPTTVTEATIGSREGPVCSTMVCWQPRTKDRRMAPRANTRGNGILKPLEVT